MTRDEITARLEELRGGIQYLAAFDELDEEQRSAWDEATAEFEQLETRAQDIAERAAAAERVAQIPSLQVIVKPSTEDVLNDRAASGGDLVDAVSRAMDDTDLDAFSQDQIRQTVRRNRGDAEWARGLAVRSTDTYRTGWSKLMTGQDALMTDAERTAMSVVTNANGGFLVPTQLDPTLIFTNTGSSNAVRGIAKVVQLTTGNVWNGVTTAGSTFSFDGELAEVSDDTPTFSRVSIPLFKAQGFVQASFETLLDTNISADLAELFADGKNRLEGDAYVNGNGTSAPKGISTAINAVTASRVTCTTANTLGAVDIDATYRAVGVRWRGNGKWLMNPLFEGKIRLLATTLGSAFTTDLTGPYTSVLYNKSVVESDDMPAAFATTSDKVLIYGDFSQYTIVDQPGSYAMQYIPTLFNTANNLPDGRVGWFATWRTGADSPNPAAFRYLRNA